MAEKRTEETQKKIKDENQLELQQSKRNEIKCNPEYFRREKKDKINDIELKVTRIGKQVKLRKNKIKQ